MPEYARDEATGLPVTRLVPPGPPESLAGIDRKLTDLDATLRHATQAIDRLTREVANWNRTNPPGPPDLWERMIADAVARYHREHSE